MKRKVIRALQDEPPIIVDDGSSLVTRCKGMTVATAKRKWTSSEDYSVCIVTKFPNSGDPQPEFFPDVDWVKFELSSKTARKKLRKLTLGKKTSGKGLDLDVDNQEDLDLQQTGTDPLGRAVYRIKDIGGEEFFIDSVTVKPKQGGAKKIDVNPDLIRKTEIRLELLS